jgi:ABC-type sugar transport system ATPase subunit
MEARSNEVAVRLEDLNKSFGAIRAVDAVNMTVDAGTMHALVGENGAGKSTALGIMAGRIAPTGGRCEVFGQELRYGDPRSSRRAGVVAVYQELTIVPALSVEANVFLAQPLSKHGVLSERQMRTRYVELCERLGVRAAPPRTQARHLSVADQQMLEILRAVNSDARIILFDEPTASLGGPEREALFALIESLKAAGTTMVFVSHNLDEVLDLADAITVFRDGRVAVSDRRAGFTKASLVNAMLGSVGDGRLANELTHPTEVVPVASDGPASAPRSRRSHNTAATPIVAAADVTVPGAVESLNIEVHAGEIVGVGGLVGSGRSTLLRALAGLEASSSGRMWIEGREVAWPRSIRQALRYGIAIIPEDRKTQGLVLPMSAMENIALSDLRKATRWGMLSQRSLARCTATDAEAFGFSPGRLREPARNLSGGNQQKLLFARWRHVTPRVLLADEPTRGIDVGAKAEILSSLEEMATSGLGLIMVSSELEEITAVADRVVVLAEGTLAGVLDRAEHQLSTANILHMAFKVPSAT